MSDLRAYDTNETDEAAAVWIERRDTSDWTDGDQKALDEWLAASLDHRVAFWRIKAAWQRTERLAVLHSMRRPVVTSRPSRWPFFGKSAAVAALAVMAAGTVYLRSGSNDWVYATPIGGHEIVHLGDGSQIELNTDTSVRVSSEAGERRVWLDKGEAFFQIRHDAQHPFTVIAPHAKIVDLGTKFLVRKEGEQTSVSLIEGSARIEPTKNGIQPVVLTPGDLATASAVTFSISKLLPNTVDAKLSWRRDVLVFDHTTLADAASEFNRYNAEQLIIADPAIASKTIGGTFPKNGLRDFTEVARDMLRLKVMKDGGQIVISR